MTTFFKKFGSIQYQLEGNSKEACNIVRAVLPKRLNVDQTFIFQKYNVQSGETPEETADRLYRNANLWWVFFVVNNLINPYTDWRMADEAVESYVNKKYNGDVNGIHHFINVNTGKFVDEVDDIAFRAMAPQDRPEFILPVTNLAHENELNQRRGDIIVINSKYISQFVDSYIKALEGKA